MNKEQEKLIKECDFFNSLYPVGTKLIVINDNREEIVRELKSEAWVLGGHSAVAMFEGISGCYLISRVKHRVNVKVNHTLGTRDICSVDAFGNPV